MGSRLKQNPERTFYWFFEAAFPVARDRDPGVLFQFPEDFNDEESSQTLPRFCFPFDIQGVRDGVPVQHFTFVLTDLEGCQRFGFCRLTNSTQTCLCILSYLPWFEVFYKLLNNLADYATKGQTTQMSALLDALYKQPIPLAAGSVTLQMGEQLLVDTEVSHPVGHPGGQEGVPYFIAPDPRSLPSIPENRNLTELIVAVDVGNLLQLYASMLFERRILIFARKLSTLTACVHAVSAVLYPMYWQHIFIPVLPPHLLDYCCAPMPYLIGVHTSLSEKVRSRGLEEVVILNVDTNTLETPFDDLKRIPSDVMTGLKACLKRQAVSPGCGVSRAFLKAQALLFGSYKDALQGPKEDGMWFSEELFLDHKSSSMRRFLQSAVHLQFFKQFIDSRLDILNKGKEPDDLFEEECDTAAGRSNSYQQFVVNLKTGGGALILNMKSKANIKAKGLARSGLKNLLMHRAHKEQNSLQRGGSVSHRRVQSDCLQNRLPIMQHFGMPRPRRPVHKHRAPSDDMKDSGVAWNGALSGPLLEPDFELQKEEEEGEDSMLCDSEEMDLLGEIFDTLSSRNSHDRGMLYGTRSLDLFGPDSHDYITKHGFPANPSQESLHSWNLESPEELSDLTEDSDWLRVATRVTEDEGLESQPAAWELGRQEHGQTAVIEKLEVKVAKDGNQEQDDTNNIKELKVEEDRQTVGQEERVNFREEPVTEMTEKPEEIKLKEKREDEQNQSIEVSEEQETEKGTNEMLKGETREDQGEKKEGTGYLQRLTELVPLLSNTVEKQEQEQNLNLTASPGPLGLAGDSKSPTGEENRHEEAVKTVEQEMKQTPSPDTLISAVALLQSQMHSQSLQVRSRAKELAEPRRPYNMFHSGQRVLTHPPGDSDTSEKKSSSEGYEEEDLPSIKVSDLKKRFEA